MAKITWTAEAQRWLEDIFGYIASDNPQHVRILLYGHYRIAYLIKDDGNIAVLGVFHGSLDITKYQL